MPIVNQAGWDNVVKINDDPYGKCAVNVASELMKTLDKGEEIGNVHVLIVQADKAVNNGQSKLTGFLAGAVSNMVRQYHSRGQEFNDKWNKRYGVSKEKAKGWTVNPALVTVAGHDQPSIPQGEQNAQPS